MDSFTKLYQNLKCYILNASNRSIKIAMVLLWQFNHTENNHWNYRVYQKSSKKKIYIRLLPFKKKKQKTFPSRQIQFSWIFFFTLISFHTMKQQLYCYIAKTTPAITIDLVFSDDMMLVTELHTIYILYQLCHWMHLFWNLYLVLILMVLYDGTIWWCYW